jgi:hypothetical protein
MTVGIHGFLNFGIGPFLLEDCSSSLSSGYSILIFLIFSRTFSSLSEINSGICSCGRFF